MRSAKKALSISKENPHDRWSGGAQSAEARIHNRIVVPVGRQSFTAQPGASFFAVGSCFARNVEERLEDAGANVTSRNIAVRDLGNASARVGGVFNKYTPLSILQELQWAAGIETFPREALLPVGEGAYMDPYLSAKASRGTADALMARRAEVNAYFAQIFEADVAILTLGLTESWTDLKTGLSLNEAPHPKILMRAPERFAFERLRLDKCRLALNKIADILKTHAKPGQKRVLTVSPVPLGRTFSSDDIIVANTISKSTLHVAALRLVSRNPDIDYFPSYEAVLHSDPNLSWQRDRRHVSDVVVGQIIQTFLLRYGIAQERSEDLEVALEELRNDPSFKKWRDETEDQEALLARLNQEVNKYKNMVIQLQRQLRQTQSQS